MYRLAIFGYRWIIQKAHFESYIDSTTHHTNHFSRLQLGSQLWFKNLEEFPLKVASIVKFL